MQAEIFRGPDLTRLLEEARQALGDDVVIVSVRGPAETGRSGYEVMAAPAALAEEAGEQLRQERGVYVVALIGPPGAGKTTTAVKLALHSAGFAGRSVGLLTLDTYRAAAVEQLQVFAEIVGLPLEVAYDAAGVSQAMHRLSDCDVVIVDTPGRGLRGVLDLDWQASLAALQADEVHLVIPASMRADVAVAMRDALRRCRPTHALLTMLNEVPGRAGVTELAEALALPARWLSDGPGVPDDLAAARPAAVRRQARTVNAVSRP